MYLAMFVISCALSFSLAFNLHLLSISIFASNSPCAIFTSCSFIVFCSPFGSCPPINNPLESQSLPFLQRSGSGGSEAGRTDEELSDVQVRLTNRGNATSSDHLLLRGEPNAMPITPGAPPSGNAGGGGGGGGAGVGGGGSQRSSLNQPLPTAPTVVATMSSSPSGVTTAVVNISPGGEAEQAHPSDDPSVSVRISSL